MGYTTSVPMSYADFRLAREMQWPDIDAVPAERVIEAREFIRLEAEYQKFNGGEGKPN